jgi:hypothetical protein
MNRKLLEKIKESLSSVLPVTGIVILIHLLLSPMPGGTFALFLIGAVLLVLGMGLFTLGADLSMMPMGERVGAHLTKSKKLSILIPVCFLIGALITIAEPDLTVLAGQVPTVPDAVLILTVAVGVGLFLVLALLRIIFRKSLQLLLFVFYGLVFVLAAFTPEEFLAAAFDSGGVTTGPITVPFIMALGIGVAAVRGGNSAQDDSFGLVTMCSIGPVLSMLLLGMFYNAGTGGHTSVEAHNPSGIGEILALFGEAIPEYLADVALALLPVVLFFLVFQILFLRLSRKRLLKMGVGLLYTFIGLVLFLTGVNVGFLPAGYTLGSRLGATAAGWIIPIGMVMGFFVVMAEPAVHVLNKQVEEITVGAISQRAMLLSLSVGVAVSIGIAMLRVVTGVSIWYFLLGGYAVALTLSFFVPKIFTAVAFDSGGVASGPMTAAFMLPFAMGACDALGGNILTDAFGLVAMVAMTPLITIQLLGVLYSIKLRRTVQAAEPEAEQIEIFEFPVEVA